jgi:hypothetical protein
MLPLKGVFYDKAKFFEILMQYQKIKVELKIRQHP